MLRLAVFVVEIVSMFPNIDAEIGRATDGDRIVAVLIPD
jgi:hypothetical protein